LRASVTEEEALVFIKPDGVIRRYVGARVIWEFIKGKELELKYFSEIQPSREFLAGRHYAQHKDKFFYDWLLEYVCSSTLLVLVLKGIDAVSKCRALLGSTIPENADCRTIRGKYGIWGGINVAHASDSSENARNEVGMWESMIKMNNGVYVQEANEYVKKYIDFPMVDSMRYREISELLIQSEITQQVAIDQFIGLLSKESDCDRDTISRFAKVMVLNALLRKPK